MSMDLLVIGDANIDLLLKVARFPLLDDEVEMDHYQRSPGGDAANVASAAARLGLNTALLACVGQDDEGTLLVNSLKTIGVNTDRLQKAKESKTGLVVGVVRSDGQRNLYAFRGANNLRRLDADLQHSLADFGMLHISDPLPREVVELAEILKKEKPAITSLDSGSITAQRGLDDLRPLLKEIKVCFLNENELLRLTGSDQVRAALDVLEQCGPEIIVIKMGSKGCLIVQGDEEISIPAFNLEAVDSTGAGDAFDAGFLYGLKNGLSLREIGRFANAVGGLATRSLGAQSALPTVEEAEKLITGKV